jgi:hypothetical protein
MNKIIQYEGYTLFKDGYSYYIWDEFEEEGCYE